MDKDNDNIEIYNAQEEVEPVQPKKKKSFWKWVWKHRELSTIFFLLFVILLTYGWGKLKINKLEKDFKKEKEALVEKHNLYKKNNLERQLKLLAKPLSWAVRVELMRKNYVFIENYAKSIVSEPGFKDFIVSNSKDEIVVTTDIAYKNKSIDIFFPFEFTEPETIKIYQVEEKNEIVVVAPIKVQSSKLGLLIFSHETN